MGLCVYTAPSCKTVRVKLREFVCVYRASLSCKIIRVKLCGLVCVQLRAVKFRVKLRVYSSEL